MVSMNAKPPPANALCACWERYSAQTGSRLACLRTISFLACFSASSSCRLAMCLSLKVGLGGTAPNTAVNRTCRKRPAGYFGVRGRLSGCRTTMQVSRSMVAFSKFSACCYRGSAASPCARSKPHHLAVTARRPLGLFGVVAGLLGASIDAARAFVAQERGENHQLEHLQSSSPNPAFQRTRRSCASPCR